jgi:catechol 2,3-dioxygenase-like lactoylglutathione lyase family enzyme
VDQRISLITLGVVDVAASRAFYERLGWSVGLDVEETVFFQIEGSSSPCGVVTSSRRTAGSPTAAAGAA